MRSDGPSDDATLFGLAPCGVLPAIRVATNAVRSYRTFSPLPFDSPLRGSLRHARDRFTTADLPRASPEGASREAVCFLCHFPSGCPARALPGALPSGVRTFLPPPLSALHA